MEKNLFDIVLDIWRRQDEAGLDRWAVFLCSKNKKPYYQKGHKFGNGHNSAVTDEDTAREMFGNVTLSTGHIGVAGGSGGGVFAFDIDVKNPGTPEHLRSPEAVEEFITTNYDDLPYTAIQMTPSGGRHRIYIDPNVGTGNDAFNGSESGVYCDIKGRGGYFVLYDFNMDFNEIVDAPLWIAEHISAKKQTDKEKSVEFGDVFEHGNRNVGLTRIAGAAWNYGDNPIRFSAFLHGYNLLHCVPPLPKSDVDRIIQSAIDNFKRDFEETDIPDAGGPVDDDDDFKCMADFLAPCPPEEFVLEKTIIEGGVSIMTGLSGCGKTWLTTHLSIAVAQGAPWLGIATKQKNVLLIDEESGKNRLMRRFKKLAVGRGLVDLSSSETVSRDSEVGALPIRGRSMRQIDLRKGPHIKKLKEQILKNEIGFIVIDALADVTPGADENNKKDMLPAINNLKYLCEETGVTVVVIHHPGKDEKSIFRGTSAIIGAVDGMFLIKRDHDSENIFFESVKERDIERIKFSAKIQFSEYSVTIEESDAINSADALVKKKQNELDDILKYVFERGEVTQAEVVKVFGPLMNVKETAIKDRIHHLIKTSFLTQEKKQTKGCVWLLVLSVPESKKVYCENLFKNSNEGNA
jgi:hypothetical protein